VLGDIPVFGELFTQREKSKTNTELVAFITPIVVNNREESERFNDPYRVRLETLRQGTGTEKSALPPAKPVNGAGDFTPGER
jgi:type II secretory pathway component GspD/PulD (secretin)